jgi:hypothetical protein
VHLRWPGVVKELLKGRGTLFQELFIEELPPNFKLAVVREVGTNISEFPVCLLQRLVSLRVQERLWLTLAMISRCTISSLNLSISLAFCSSSSTFIVSPINIEHAPVPFGRAKRALFTDGIQRLTLSGETVKLKLVIFESADVDEELDSKGSTAVTTALDMYIDGRVRGQTKGMSG